MITFWIVLGIIIWCIVGYFINILTIRITNYIMGYGREIDRGGISFCIWWCMFFPLILITWIPCSLMETNRKIPKIKIPSKLLNKLYKLHNKAEKE